MVDATRKLPMDCGSLRTRVITRSSWRKTVDSEASFQASKVQRVDEIGECSRSSGSFPSQDAGRPIKAGFGEAAMRMSKVGKLEVLVPDKTMEVISPIRDSKLKAMELVVSREEVSPVHQGDDGNVSLKTFDNPKLDDEPDENLALVKAFLPPQPPARLYPPPKIRKGFSVVRDFPPGCGGLTCASRSKDEMESCVSKDVAGEVKGKQAHVGRDESNPLPATEEKVALNSAPQVASSKFEEDIHTKKSDDMDAEDGTGVQVRGLCGCASWSKGEMENCVSKDDAGEVKGKQAQIRRSSDLKMVLGRDDRHPLPATEENVALNSAPQVASSKFEEDIIKKDSEDGTGIQVKGLCGLKVVPGGVHSRAPLLLQKKWSPSYAPQVVNAEIEENLVGEREKTIETLKPNYGKQTSFTQSAEDTERVEDDKEQYDLSSPPSDCKSNISNRYKVREALNQFRMVFEEISEAPESQLKENLKTVRNFHVEAATILKRQQRWVNTTKLLGPVPGIEVGDQFRFRAELVVVGLHRQFQAGIDYMMGKGGLLFATSIVDSGRYANEAESPDVLVYSGAGGNPSLAKHNKPEDQKLKRGNIALKNSMDSQMPVRVIRGRQNLKSSNNREWTPKYMYDGLYKVTSYKQEIGKYGKLVFMFKLDRLPGQPKINWETCDMSKVVNDISQGKEKIPIRVMNNLDNEKPLPFHYITKLFCLRPRNRSLPVGCDCKNGCSDVKSCLCIQRNGGQIPFSDTGSIITDKPLVYECGPSCKCPPSCKNRVSQHGIRYQLEVFKTKSVGWGVRSRNYISAGSFICEYVGELLQDRQAELRRFDDYLFDVSSDEGYTIDAAHCGNVGRFINHSCSPNLYAENVLYDHHNEQFPHIMFFAAKNIPPLRELTFDYNYKLDSIRDEDGNIKRKNCYCGSAECRGRMY